MDYLETLKKRRSIYDFTSEVIDPKMIDDLVGAVLTVTPSAYNAQTQRVVILHNDNHLKLWDLIEQKIKDQVSAEAFGKAKKKLAGFKKAQGTILYFDDHQETKALMEKFPLYKDAFQRWSVEQNGMLQVNVWNALRAIDIGASLQHYNELIETEVKELFKLPKEWLLHAQMPYGKIEVVPDLKPKRDLSERMKVMN
ncbi:MAG: nitroreductase family protein [Candidatus Izemoplasmatales bacterium]|jgi:hypothetical protein